MTGLVLSVVMQVSVLGATAESPDYATAWKSAQEDGRPLMVLVSADWCPACQVLKTSTLPKMQKAGKLKPVVYTIVNADRQKSLASKIMSGGTVPQLIIYKPTEDGWHRSQIIGSQGEAAVESFIQKAVRKR